MAKNYPNDITNGREVPPLVIDEDHIMRGIHQGSVHVERGKFVLVGDHQGSLDIQSPACATIAGQQRGSVHIATGAVVTVSGGIQGSSRVEPGATLVIEERARLAGSLHNDGVVIVRGAFGGSQSGDGELRLEGRGYIKEPTSSEDGVTTYVW